MPNARMSIVGLLALLAGALTIASGSARAETLLRWKLAAGQRFTLQLAQQTNSSVAAGKKPARSAVEMNVALQWQVDSVDAAGARITQQVERVQIKLQPAGAEAILYDSGLASKPVGPAKDLAAVAAPLVGAKFQIVMNDRGEITAAEPTPEFQATLNKQRGEQAAAAPNRGELYSAESIGRLLRQTLVVLPEKGVEKGAAWSRQNSTPGPLGKFEQQIDYTYAGSTERGGVMLEQIDFVAKFAVPTSKAGAKLTVKEQTHSGTIIFDAQAGRVVEAEQMQKLVTETTYRDATIIVELETNGRSTLKPLN